MRHGTARFPTFCHISEYGEEGYQHLHRMIAISAPLNLWSPSGVLLNDPGCSVTPGEFVRYIEQGDIRIMGRHEWLFEPKYRDRYTWDGARWYGPVDDAIRAIGKEDERERDERKRVLVAPPEDGWDWAGDFLTRNPSQVRVLHRAITGKRAAEQFPTGVLEAVKRYGPSPEEVATAVLRDARNHGQAIRLAKAEVPFLLGSGDSRFMRLLARVGVEEEATEPPVTSAPSRRAEQHLSELSGQLLQVLGYLDMAQRKPESLRAFMAGEGHQVLVAWFRMLCERVKRTDPRHVEREVAEALKTELARGQFPKPLHDLLGASSRATMSASIGGLASDVIELQAGPTNLMRIAGFAPSAFLLGHGALKALGYIPTDYDGPQWPYLYAFGSRATRRQARRMRRMLQQMP
jgi:hypothetical protein